MIENVLPREQVGPFARRQALATVRKTVKKTEVEAAIAEGWVVRKTNKRSKSLEKPKKKSTLLESRVWSMLYRMGFLALSGEGGATLTVNPVDENSPTTQLDVVAVDDEVALCIECKSFESPRKEPRFAEKLAKLSMAKKKFAEGIAKAFPVRQKRHVAAAMFTWDLVLTESDTKRAEDERVAVFDEHDLEYYEALVRHLGPAARYQFLAEIFPGRPIAGLHIRVPALRARMGDLTCYTFSLRPDYLLKIAYVAHRAKGKAIDIDAYQRMISRSRLNQIAEYITENGVFPTNIVVNIEDRRRVQFDRGKQEGDSSGALFGWLTISPCYGAAWIIDGQHRLFAYSGHPRAATSFLNVLALEGLSASRQAQMFVDINSEQRRVRRSLLVELDAQLKWDSDDEDKRVDAIVSKAWMGMDEAPDSPLLNRVLLADATRTNTRCVSLTSLAAALNKAGFFIIARKKGITEYGPLWRDDPTASLRRTVAVLKGWLSPIADAAGEWWALGAEEGGGLAMNNGVTVCVNILRSVLEHIDASSRLSLLEDQELVERITPYAVALGGIFVRMEPARRKAFRELQGIDGQNTGTRECQEALRTEFPKFSPEGLDDWIRRREANTNDQARKLIDAIETTLNEMIIGTLKEEFAEDPQQWWFDGVPKNVRLKVDQRINESDGKAGQREQNFDLIHYRDIIHENWGLFGETFGYGQGAVAKTKRTEWIQEVGLMRNIVMHPSRREFLSFEKLNRLQSLKQWLDAQVARTTGAEGRS